jgi:hypothetical protein
MSIERNFGYLRAFLVNYCKSAAPIAYIDLALFTVPSDIVSVVPQLRSADWLI